MSNAHILSPPASLSLPAHMPSSLMPPPTAAIPPFPRSPFIYIDAHILATPAIADLDGDGAEELVVAVSYFYDRQYYEKEVGHFIAAVALQQNRAPHAMHGPLPPPLPAAPSLVCLSRSCWHR